METTTLQRKKKRMTRKIEECFRLIQVGNERSFDIFRSISPALTTEELDNTYNQLRCLMDAQCKAFRIILSEPEE